MNPILEPELQMPSLPNHPLILEHSLLSQATWNPLNTNLKASLEAIPYWQTLCHILGASSGNSEISKSLGLGGQNTHPPGQQGMRPGSRGSGR